MPSRTILTRGGVYCQRYDDAVDGRRHVSATLSVPNYRTYSRYTLLHSPSTSFFLLSLHSAVNTQDDDFGYTSSARSFCNYCTRYIPQALLLHARKHISSTLRSRRSDSTKSRCRPLTQRRPGVSHPQHCRLPSRSGSSSLFHCFLATRL